MSFLTVICIGTILLMLPFSSRSGQATPLMNALFTATSATCVTGLVVYDTYQYWSLFGRIVIIILIQIGGLGLVTITTFFNMLIRRKMGLRTVYLAKESVSSDDIMETSSLVKTIIATVFAIELAGMILLCFYFVPVQGFLQGLGTSAFLSVSAFCNAGFDVLGYQGEYASLVHFYNNPYILYIIMLLIISGGLGFAVWQDIYNYKKNKKFKLHSKIVLMSTAVLIVLGAALILLFEWNNPRTLADMSIAEKINNSFFGSVTTRTAGFNSFSVEGMHSITKVVNIFLMFIGAAPGSTGGGVKITTVVVIFATVYSVVKNRQDTIIMEKKVHKSVVYKALAVVMIAMCIVIVATLCLAYLDYNLVGENLVDVLYETVSAFATVGLSSGVTAITNPASRLVLILTMFIGRVGPVAMALTFAMRNQDSKNKVIPEGKIIVG